MQTHRIALLTPVLTALLATGCQDDAASIDDRAFSADESGETGGAAEADADDAPEADTPDRELLAATVNVAGSCSDACGGQSASGCWCDDACDGYGDCCSDKADFCSIAAGPQQLRGLLRHQGPGGCYCDAECAQYGDCCADKVDVCDAPPPPPEPEPGSCEDACGGQSADGCWCDDQCAQYGDCCPDIDAVCNAADGGQAGDDCEGQSDCAEGLVCEGIPNGYAVGKCISTAALPGQEASCSADSQCAEGLTCIGEVIFGEGSCNPAWMAGTYTSIQKFDLVDGGSISSEQLVYGLATVPVEISVTFNVDHADKSQLRVLLHDPNGVTATVWNREANPSNTVQVVGIPGDDTVNGVWRLEVLDEVAGTTGVLTGWTLDLTSRYD